MLTHQQNNRDLYGDHVSRSKLSNRIPLTYVVPYVYVFRTDHLDQFQSIITVTSKWALWRLKSPASRLFTQPFDQAQIKENSKAPRHWLWWGNSPVTGGFPAQKDRNAENVSIWWRHHIRFISQNNNIIAICPQTVHWLWTINTPDTPFTDMASLWPSMDM